MPKTDWGADNKINSLQLNCNRKKQDETEQRRRTEKSEASGSYLSRRSHCPVDALDQAFFFSEHVAAQLGQRAHARSCGSCITARVLLVLVQTCFMSSPPVHPVFRIFIVTFLMRARTPERSRPRREWVIQ